VLATADQIDEAALARDPRGAIGRRAGDRVIADLSVGVIAPALEVSGGEQRAHVIVARRDPARAHAVDDRRRVAILAGDAITERAVDRAAPAVHRVVSAQRAAVKLAGDDLLDVVEDLHRCRERHRLRPIDPALAIPVVAPAPRGRVVEHGARVRDSDREGGCRSRQEHARRRRHDVDVADAELPALVRTPAPDVAIGIERARHVIAAVDLDQRRGRERRDLHRKRLTDQRIGSELARDRGPPAPQRSIGAQRAGERAARRDPRAPGRELRRHDRNFVEAEPAACRKEHQHASGLHVSPS
jgi:hypothetical protein